MIELFTGSSVEVTQLSPAVSNNSEVSVFFKTKNPSGLILYAGDSATEDYVVLYLHRGHLRFLLNCGISNTFETHNLAVNDGRWHKLVFKRPASEKPFIRLDRRRLFRPYYQSRTCNAFSTMYLGGLPSDIGFNTAPYHGITHRLGGCLKNLHINGKELTGDIRYRAVSQCDGS